jgi:hypothetical protein
LIATVTLRELPRALGYRLPRSNFTVPSPQHLLQEDAVRHKAVSDLAVLSRIRTASDIIRYATVSPCKESLAIYRGCSVLIHPVRLWSADAVLSVSVRTVQSDFVTVDCPMVKTLTGYSGQHQIRNVGFNDCRKSWTSWRPSPTGNSSEFVHPALTRTSL